MTFKVSTAAIGGGGATVICNHHHSKLSFNKRLSPTSFGLFTTQLPLLLSKPNSHHLIKLNFISRAADSTQPSSPAKSSLVADEDFSLAKVSFGVIGLYGGVSLLGYGFGAYFNILPGSEWSAIMLTYGFPLAIIGMALKYAELKPVPCLTYADAQLLRESCATPILKQYGLGAGIPRRSAPTLQLIREEVTGDGRYCLVLVFEAKDLQLSDFEKRQVLKDRIAWLEATNENLCRELHGYRSRSSGLEHCGTDVKVGEIASTKTEGLKRGLQSIDSPECQMSESGDSIDIDEEAAKEWEHTLLQDSMDKELHELNKRLEQKESEMKLFGGFDTMTLKQHFGKKIVELEDEKRTVQHERDRLLAEVENLSYNSDGQKLQDVHSQKLKALEAQIQDLKKKQESQVQLLKQKQKSDEAAKRLQDEIHFIKAQKVQLQHKIKQEAEQFRQWKASREKELLQLKKEGRRNEYERHKLQALNQRQKMVLQRKTEEAAMATKRLKELLEARKSSPRDNSAISHGNGANGQTNEKSLQRWLDHELEVMVKVHEVRYEYEKQSQVRAALAEELAVLKQVDEYASKGLNLPRGKNGLSRVSSMSPNARMSRISSLENMLSISSNSLVAMASQLSEAEERERAFTSRGHWNQLRSMADAKNLLQYMFNSLGDARCQLWEKDIDNKEMEDQLKELVSLLRQSETRRKEVERDLKIREQDLAIALNTSASGNSHNSLKHVADDMSGPLSPISVPAQKQLKYSAGIANASVRESAAFIDQARKMVPVGHLSMKKLSAAGHAGKLWRWKRSHHQWLLQFKWKWQKPWRLSELIRHSDETIMKGRPRPQALPDVIRRR